MSARVAVVAVDPSEHALKAFDFYFEHIHKDGNTVVVAHCPEMPSLPSFTFREGLAVPADEWANIMKEQNKAQQDVEEEYMKRLMAKKVSNYKVKMDHHKGSPGEHIVKIAEDEGASMIVMGSRGLGKIRRTILGSVSDYVVHHSKCPVVVVPDK